MAAPVSGSRSKYPPPRQSTTDWEHLARLAGVVVGGTFEDEEPEVKPLPIARVHRRSLFNRFLERLRK